MWAPGAYISQGRVTLPAPNIGIERYFFKVADTILSHIKSSRGTVILPQRTGPIADVLYSAAGNSADENWYKRGIIAYSFEAGAQRITVNPTTGAITRQAVGFQPCFAGPGTNGGQGATCTTGNPPVPNPLMVNEGHDSTMEFAEGNFGEIQGALEYLNDVIAAGDDDRVRRPADVGRPDPLQVQLGRRAVGDLLHDGWHDADCDHGQPGDRRRRRLRRPARRRFDAVLQRPGPAPSGRGAHARHSGAHTIKWTSVDMKGNQEAVHSQRLLVAADDESGTPSGTVPPTLVALARAAASFPSVHAWRGSDLHGRDHGERDLDRRRRAAVGVRPELGRTPASW